MKTSADNPIGQGAQREFSFAPPDAGSLSLQPCLAAIAAGTAALNLNPDYVPLTAEIAAFEPDLTTEHQVALILLLVVSLAAIEEGSTRFPMTGAESVQPMRRMLGPLCGAAFGAGGAERMRIAIEQMLVSGSAPGVIGTGPDDFKPLIYLRPFIYPHRLLCAERALAQRLAALIKTPPLAVDDQNLHNLLAEFAAEGSRRLDLSAEQRAAIGCAARAPLTIISGGPGTGKTSIVLAILRVLLGGGLAANEIALAAPTGKAAYRIGESISENLPADPGSRAAKAYPKPTTVHRLLGYSPTRRRFRYHRNNPLEARLVVIDEGSMLDLELMARLLDALRPDARLIILGDGDQLPSVSAGAVFRDLLPAADADSSALSRNCVRLTRSYRMDIDRASGGAILRLRERHVNAGGKDVFALTGSDGAAAVLRRDCAEQLDFAGTEWLDQEPLSGAFLERWYAKQLRGEEAAGAAENHVFLATEDGFATPECDSLRRVFAQVSSARILCVTRVLDSGSDRINALLHRRVAREKGTASDRERFMVGEPVMVLRNDYERGLFNGDQGVVLRVGRPGSEAKAMAVFPRAENFVGFPLDALKEHLELCYAMTVHKAQGSEFDAVAVIMPSKDLPILTREILYTAVSRARRSVTIVGAREIIGAGVARG